MYSGVSAVRFYEIIAAKLRSDLVYQLRVLQKILAVGICLSTAIVDLEQLLQLGHPQPRVQTFNLRLDLGEGALIFDLLLEAIKCAAHVEVKFFDWRSHK